MITKNYVTSHHVLLIVEKLLKESSCRQLINLLVKCLFWRKCAADFTLKIKFDLQVICKPSQQINIFIVLLHRAFRHRTLWSVFVITLKICLLLTNLLNRYSYETVKMINFKGMLTDRLTAFLTRFLRFYKNLLKILAKSQIIALIWITFHVIVLLVECDFLFDWMSTNFVNLLVHKFFVYFLLFIELVFYFWTLYQILFCFKRYKILLINQNVTIFNFMSD